MKISLKFSELSASIGYANTVLSDKSVEDKFKNLIFLCKEDDVKLVAYSAFTFSRTSMDAEVDLDGKADWYFQVKASEVNKILSSFSSMYKTKVDAIDFEEDGVKIKVVVHEVPKEDKDEALTRDVDFYLENAPILPKVKSEIEKEFPEDVEGIAASELLLYLDSLFPLLNNDASNGLSSKLNFADDYVFVLTSSMSSFMQNKLPDAFHDITITYSSANFLKKVVEKADTIGVAKDGRYICVQSENTEAFMQFQKVKVKYKMHIDKRSKDRGIVIDRLYLKDVLKRMSCIDNDGIMRVTDEGELLVSNKNFQQIVPLCKTKDASGVGFNISIAILDKAILGRDDVFSSDVFMYFVETQRGYIIYLSDKTGAWFSNTQVTRA